MPEAVRPQTALRVALLAVLLAGCPTKNGGPADSGQPLPNICNAQSDAQTEAQCQLTLAAPPVCFYLDHSGKDLWLGVTMPSTLNAQSLLELQAGYSPSSGSPVQLSMNVVTGNQASLATATDKHGQGSPSILSIVTTPPATLAGQQIFIIFSDSSGTAFDIRNQFCVSANVVQDPDPNQVGVPTVVTLSSANGVETNTPPNIGNLSTTGRVDEYEVDIDPSISRPILYMSISVPPEPDGGVLTPPIKYLLGYNIYDCGPSGTASATTCAGNPPSVLPGGTVVATAHMPNEFSQVDLVTSLLVKSGDMYIVEVQGFNTNDANKTPVPGDPRVTYNLALQEMPDLDPYDGTTPTPINPSLGGSAVTLSSGRLSYVAQVDTFAITMPAQGSNTRIHYLITPGTTGSRFPQPFPAISETPRIATLAVPVAASQGADPGLACNTDWNTCPNDTGNLTAGSPAIGLPEQFCELDGGPQCLYSYRQEDPGYPNLGNFEGIIPVKAGTTLVNLQYQDQAGVWADDIPYTVSVTWLQEGSENQSSYHWSQATAINAGTLATAPATTTLSGNFTLGDSLTDNSVQTVHGTNDYDAIPSTLDVFELAFPSVSSAALYGATWNITITQQNSGANGPPVTLEFAPFFCSPMNGGTIGCTSQQEPDPFIGLQDLFYNNSGGTWWNTGSTEVVWTQTMMGGNTVDTSQPGACFCFEPNYLAGGNFYLYVTGSNRTSYADSTFSLAMSIDTYPSSQTFGDGGVCPSTAPNPDAGIVAVGCQFAPTGCGGQGSQCISNGDCCSDSCNTSNPCPPTAGNNNGGNSTGGVQCSNPGYGFCN